MPSVAFQVGQVIRNESARFCQCVMGTWLFQGGHIPGKYGKPGKLREFEKLSKSQGKLREILIFVEKPGKLLEDVKYVT